jgi:hypothetical protein
MKRYFDLMLKYSNWSLASHIAFLGIFSIGIVALLAHYFMPTVVSIEFVLHFGVGLSGLFGVIISLEAVRADVFPRMGVYDEIRRGESPVQFWIAVLIFGLVCPVACLAYGLSPALIWLGIYQ